MGLFHSTFKWGHNKGRGFNIEHAWYAFAWRSQKKGNWRSKISRAELIPIKNGERQALVLLAGQKSLLEDCKT